MTRRWLTVAVLCLAMTGVGRAARSQSSLPDGVAAAEADSQWNEAARLYRAALVEFPRRADWWVRLADVEAAQGDLVACIDALQHAAAADPSSSSILARLSRAYATADLPKRALEAIDAALALEPDSREFLRSLATLATWTGEYDRARDAYRQLRRLGESNPELDLAYARVSAWSGETDKAVGAYRRYLASHPEAADVVIELAKAESWRGNFSAAREALDLYRQRFGDSNERDRELAAAMTGADRPNRAQEILTPLLAGSPDDVELRRTRAMAYARQGRAREAFASLAMVKQIAPETPETIDTERVVRTLLASAVEPRASVYSDSDQLEVRRLAPRATVALNTGTQLSTGYDRTELEAARGTGLEQVDGTTTALIEQPWVAASQKIKRLVFSGTAGYATAGVYETTTYAAGLDARLADSLRLSIDRSHGFFAVSPRTVGLGLTEISDAAQVDWSPTLRVRVAAEGRYQTMSDGNSRWEVTLSPRRAFARRSDFNLDLGVMAYRLSTTSDRNSGYYDPRRYEQYAATIFPYFKIDENVGLAVAAALGVQRENSRPFRFGGNIAGEATFGIYQLWTLKIGASATKNQRLDSGAFEGFSSSVSLIRRF